MEKIIGPCRPELKKRAASTMHHFGGVNPRSSLSGELDAAVRKSLNASPKFTNSIPG